MKNTTNFTTLSTIIMRQQLEQYFPKESIAYVEQLFDNYIFQLRISKERKTKKGDFRPAIKRKFHVITINHNLHQLEFFITFIHEIAHLIVWQKCKNNVTPHGEVWLETYHNLLKDSYSYNCFKENEWEIIKNHFIKYKEKNLDSLKKWMSITGQNDKENDLILENIKLNECFKITDGRMFRKIKKLRKFYLCEEISTKRKYRIHPYAMVQKF